MFKSVCVTEFLSIWTKSIKTTRSSESCQINPGDKSKSVPTLVPQGTWRKGRRPNRPLLRRRLSKSGNRIKWGNVEILSPRSEGYQQPTSGGSPRSLTGVKGWVTGSNIVKYYAGKRRNSCSLFIQRYQMILFKYWSLCISGITNKHSRVKYCTHCRLVPTLSYIGLVRSLLEKWKSIFVQCQRWTVTYPSWIVYYISWGKDNQTGSCFTR